MTSFPRAFIVIVYDPLIFRLSSRPITEASPTSGLYDIHSSSNIVAVGTVGVICAIDGDHVIKSRPEVSDCDGPKNNRQIDSP